MQDENKFPPISVDDIDNAPTTAVVSSQDVSVSTADFRDAFVRLSEENAILKEDLDKTKKRVRTIEILDELIEPFAHRTFWFMCVYCGIVAILVTLHGFTGIAFTLPESVLQ